MSVPSAQGQGALFELVARGVKDKYFVADEKDSTFVYDASYASSLPHLAERRTAVPVNGTTFGGTFEVEIDPYGDILTECALEIQLPTWYPPLALTPGGAPVDPSVVNGLCEISSVGSGISYGYVNGVGWFLLESVQFYQDQFLIQEWSGDGLWAKQRTEGSYNHGQLRLARGGASDTAERTELRNIQLRATPGHLRVELPLIGLGPRDVGLPLIGMPWQTLRIRVTLRRLEDLIVCSDDGILSPAPWAVPLFQYTMTEGTVHTFSPLSLPAMGQPTILLSTVQRYVTPETQQIMRETRFEIPFRRMFENRFTFGELDYISLDKGGVSAVTRRLEGRHPTERMFWFFRLQSSIDKGRLDDVTNSYIGADGRFYSRLKLVIAGRDRERLEESIVWNKIAPWAKQERVTGTGEGIGEMNWGLGDQMGTTYPAERVPTGTVNFTTADRPTLFLELVNVPSHPVRAERVVEFRVFTEAWNVYDITEGRGRVRFAS